MEKLSDLPPKDDAEMSPQESDVMQKYFDASTGGGSKPGASGKTGWMDTIKLALYATVLFLILANPWIDSVMCMVPYCGESALTLTAVKALLFLIFFVVMYKFAISS
jgi:hypothetical protein